MPLPGPGRDRAAESSVLAQAAAAEGLEEEETSAWAAARSDRARVPISSLNRARKLSAAASSKHDPMRPQLCGSPDFLIRSWKRVDVCSATHVRSPHGATGRG